MAVKNAVAGVLWFGIYMSWLTQARTERMDVEETRVKMTALRDAFAQSVKDAGFTCPIAVPSVLVEDVPSFGSYDPETNTLRTSAWSLLKPDESQMFYHFMGPNATEEIARKSLKTACITG